LAQWFLSSWNLAESPNKAIGSCGYTERNERLDE
jgi:hypothetical protein